MNAGDGALDGRSDLYSLGCVLYELLAGEPPFTGPTASAIVAKRLSGPVPQIRIVRPLVAAAVEQALCRALGPVPADRFRTAGEFRAALAASGSGTDETPARTTSPVAARPASSLRRLARRTVLGALALAAVLAAALVVRGGGHGPTLLHAAPVRTPVALDPWEGRRRSHSFQRPLPD